MSPVAYVVLTSLIQLPCFSAYKKNKVNCRIMQGLLGRIRGLLVEVTKLLISVGAVDLLA
jgi:hypothetical protein